MRKLCAVRAQVVVVGGGPVGLLVAAELAGYGIDTVLLETQDEVSERPKATTLHARAVQGLARRGYLPGGGAPYARCQAGQPFHFAGLPGLVITAPENEPEPILKCPQAKLERLFEQRAGAAGAQILRGYRVTRVRQDADEVRVEAEGPQGPAVFAAPYVVGADGARGTVREQVGIACDTRPASVSALMGAVTIEGAEELADGWHRTPRGWIAAKRDPEGRTHIRTLNCAGPHGYRQLAPTLEELRGEVAWIAGRDIGMREPRWLSRFSDFTRLARTYRAGGVFLVGDAAHVHFPIGGQGLSTGVLDALNLGWKLALAVLGAAGSGLLDSYDAERRPVAARVIENTRAQLALMRPGAESDALRGVFTGLLASEDGQRGHGHLGAMVSGQDTVLPPLTGCPSPAAGTFLGNIAITTATGESDVIGLMRGGRPQLLLFGEQGGRYREQARAWEGIVRVVSVLPTPEVPYEALLVRPDGYIAWAPGGEELSVALSAYFAAGVRVGVP